MEKFETLNTSCTGGTRLFYSFVCVMSSSLNYCCSNYNKMTSYHYETIFKNLNIVHANETVGRQNISKFQLAQIFTNIFHTESFA